MATTSPLFDDVTFVRTKESVGKQNSTLAYARLVEAIVFEMKEKDRIEEPFLKAYGLCCTQDLAVSRSCKLGEVITKIDTYGSEWPKTISTFFKESKQEGRRVTKLDQILLNGNNIAIFVRKGNPSWDFDESDGSWKWMKPAPAIRKSIDALEPKDRKKMRKTTRTVRDKLLKEFGCQICCKVMTLPVTTPCAHNFCKACLEGKFAGITQVRERSRGGRSLRVKKNMKKCPCCTIDLSEFLQNPQVNREVMDLIENLKKKEGEENSENATASSSGCGNT